MFIKPNDEIHTALARLAKSAEWEVLEKWLVGSREACITASLTADNAKARQAQGSMQAIDELLRHTRDGLELSTRR